MSATATVELPDGATLHYPDRPSAHISAATELPPWANDPSPAEPLFINPFTLLDGACN